MTILRVKAAPGLQVPLENSPHRYINDAEAVEVEPSAYYLRALECGDLRRAAPDKPQRRKGADDGQR